MATVLALTQEEKYSRAERSVSEDLDEALEQLNTAWSSLEVMYQACSDALSGTAHDQLIAKMLDRVLEDQPQMKAALCAWSGGSLKPEILRPADSDLPAEVCTVSERAIRSKRTLALRMGSDTGYVVASPVNVGDNPWGALVFWSPDLHIDSSRVRLFESVAVLCGGILNSDRLHRLEVITAGTAREIEIASQVQERFLHGVIPAKLEGMSVAACSTPAQQVGGDLYDFIAHAPNCIDVLIGDVMGKGIATALLAAALKERLLRCMFELTTQNRGAKPRVEAVVTALNTAMADQLERLHSFVTLVYARVDTGTNTLTVLDCGHTESLLYRSRSGVVEALKGVHTPLGFPIRERFVSRRVPVQPGDIVVFYSDGLTEAKGKNGGYYGQQQLMHCIERNAQSTAEQILQAIRTEVHDFAGLALGDDFTCVAVKIAPEPLPNRDALILPGRLDQLAVARHWLRTFCRQRTTVADRWLADLELAITELLSNVFRHGSLECAATTVTMTTELTSEHLALTFAYKGKSFDRQAVPEPLLDGSRDGGYGLFIIDQCIDSVTYSESIGGVQNVRFEKALSAPRSMPEEETNAG